MTRTMMCGVWLLALVALCAAGIVWLVKRGGETEHHAKGDWNPEQDSTQPRR